MNISEEQNSFLERFSIPALLWSANGQFLWENEAAKALSQTEENRPILQNLILDSKGSGHSLRSVIKLEGNVFEVTFFPLEGAQDSEEELLLMILHRRDFYSRFSAMEETRSTNELLFTLSSSLAHEIQNPLAAIKAAAQFMQEEKNLSLNGLIIEECDRLASLVRSMEVFSTQQEIEFDALNIHEVLDHVLQLAQVLYRDEVEIIRDFDPSLPLVEGERNRLVQIVLNLLKNAIEASLEEKEGPQKPKIILRTRYMLSERISVTHEKQKKDLPICVSVCDQAGGIAPNLQEQLFLPFSSTKGERRGLGLPIVAKLMTELQGVLDYETSSQGTSFDLYLPIVKECERSVLKYEGEKE